MVQLGNVANSDLHILGPKPEHATDKNMTYFSKPYLSDLTYTFANKSVKNEYYGTVFDWGTRILVMCGGEQVSEMLIH